MRGRARHIGSIVVVLLALGAAAPAGAASDGWSVRRPGMEVRDLVQDHDRGRLFVAGNDDDAGDLAVTSYSSDGAHRWTSRYDEPTGTADEALDAELAPDGETLFVAGATGGPSWAGTGNDFLVGAFDADSGAQRWKFVHGGPLDRTDRAWAVVADPTGARVFATGTQDSNTAFTVGLDAASGAELWRAEEVQGNGRAYDLVVTPDGATAIVLGRKGVYDGFAVAYDAATGAQRWFRDRLGRFPYHATLDATGTRLFTVIDGHRAVALDVATGATVWTNANVSGAWFYGGLLLTEDTVYLTGDIATDWQNSWAVLTAAFDRTTGALLWRREYDGRGRQYTIGPGHHGLSQYDPNWGTDIDLAPDGNTLRVSAVEYGPSMSKDIAIVSYDARTGADLGLTRLGDGFPGDLSRGRFDEANYPIAIGPTPDGGLIVAGEAVYTHDGGWRSDLTLQRLPPTTCPSGGNENGPASRLLHEMEPETGPGAEAVHLAGCAVADDAEG